MKDKFKTFFSNIWKFLQFLLFTIPILGLFFVDYEKPHNEVTIILTTLIIWNFISIAIFIITVK